MSDGPVEPDDAAPTTPGYPEEVDPSQGAAAARENDQLGDLENPGAAI